MNDLLVLGLLWVDLFVFDRVAFSWYIGCWPALGWSVRPTFNNSRPVSSWSVVIYLAWLADIRHTSSWTALSLYCRSSNWPAVACLACESYSPLPLDGLLQVFSFDMLGVEGPMVDLRLLLWYPSQFTYCWHRHCSIHTLASRACFVFCDDGPPCGFFTDLKFQAVQ